MHKTIASFDGHHIPDECKNVFHLGVKLIEKEFDTTIGYELKLIPTDKKIELRLNDATLQQWFVEVAVREIVIYKLTTHLKICLEQFLSNVAPAA